MSASKFERISLPSDYFDYDEVMWKRTDGVRFPEENLFEVVKSDGGSSDYYDLPEGCTTLQDIIAKKEMDFTQGNVFKAAYRWAHKPDLAYNLRKIIWFAEDALRRLEAQDEPGRKCENEDRGT